MSIWTNHYVRYCHCAQLRFYMWSQYLNRIFIFKLFLRSKNKLFVGIDDFNSWPQLDVNALESNKFLADNQHDTNFTDLKILNG